MIYLDYSATTPVREEVLDSFNQVSRNFIGNANSLHQLGVKSRHLMEEAVKQMAHSLGVLPEEIIFTSSASESNNLALCGVVEKYPMRNRQIVTTALEHSSILETTKYLAKKGYRIDLVALDENGHIDLDDLDRLLKMDPILVSIGWVNSEVGIVQDIPKIARFTWMEHRR